MTITGFCPHPEKKKFPNGDAAWNYIYDAWNNMRGGPLPRRAYECECGQWHTTKNPIMPGKFASMV